MGVLHEIYFPLNHFGSRWHSLHFAFVALNNFFPPSSSPVFLRPFSMSTSEQFLYIEPPTISIASGLISCICHRMVYPIQWVSLHPSDSRPTDVVSLHCPLWYSGSKSLLAFTSILCHAIVRLTILGRYYFNWSQWERAYLCSLVLRWEFFGHILVLSHVLVLSFFWDPFTTPFLRNGCIDVSIDIDGIDQNQLIEQSIDNPAITKKEYKWARGNGKLESVKFNFWRNCFL